MTLATTLGDLRTSALVNALAARLAKVKTETFGDTHDDVMNEAPLHRPDETLAKVKDKTLGHSGRWRTRLKATECTMWTLRHWFTRCLTR